MNKKPRTPQKYRLIKVERISKSSNPQKRNKFLVTKKKEKRHTKMQNKKKKQKQHLQPKIIVGQLPNYNKIKTKLETE